MKSYYVTMIVMILWGLGQVFAQSPPEYQLLHQKGRTALDSAKYEEALVFFDQAIHKMPYYSQIWFDRGQAKLNLQDYQGAIYDLSVAIEKNPHKTQMYLQRGLAYRAIQYDELALADFEQAIQISPNNTVAKKYFQEIDQKIAQEIQADVQNNNENLLLIQSQNEYRRQIRRQRRNQIICNTALPVGVFLLLNRWVW
jgi:tetratricopeptide (TPR) repeat protein